MKRFNLQELIWFFILAILEGLLIYLIVSEKAFLLVEVRIKKYLMLSIFIIFLFIIIQLSRIFTVPSRRKNTFGYLIFLVGVTFIYLVSNIDIIGAAIELNGFSLVPSEHKEHIKNYEVPAINLEKDTISLNQENFHEALELFLNNIDEYLGKNIELEGIFYKKNDNDDKFIMVVPDLECCIADSNYLGILCRSLENKNIKNGDKIKIIGKFDKMYINNGKLKQQVPLIIVDDIIK